MTSFLAAIALLLTTQAAALPVSPATTTAGVSTLELVDPATWTGRTVPAGNGVHFRICGALLRPCALKRGALRARTQALELARRTLRATEADLVVVALPQSATRHVLLVFERDVVDAAGDADTLTRDRLYAMGGLLNVGTADSLLLVKLPASTLGV